MKRLIAGCLLAFALTVSIGAPLAYAAAAVGVGDGNGGIQPCASLCIPWFNNTKLCVVLCPTPDAG